MSYSPIATSYFAVKSIDKTQHGEVGRSTVAAGQAAGLVQDAAKGNSIFSGTARSILSGCSNLAKAHTAFKYAGKVVQFAADHVNPLICVSSVIKTGMSDDKVGTGITEVGALSAMFAGEGFIKQHYDKAINSKTCKDKLAKAAKNKYLKPVFEYLEKNNLKGTAGTIIKGLVFITASVSSYAAGQHIGEDISKRVKANLGIKTKAVNANKKLSQEKINRMA